MLAGIFFNPSLEFWSRWVAPLFPFLSSSLFLFIYACHFPGRPKFLIKASRPCHESDPARLSETALARCHKGSFATSPLGLASIIPVFFHVFSFPHSPSPLSSPLSIILTLISSPFLPSSIPPLLFSPHPFYLPSLNYSHPYFISFLYIFYSPRVLRFSPPLLPHFQLSSPLFPLLFLHLFPSSPPHPPLPTSSYPHSYFLSFLPSSILLLSSLHPPSPPLPIIPLLFPLLSSHLLFSSSPPFTPLSPTSNYPYPYFLSFPSIFYSPPLLPSPPTPLPHFQLSPRYFLSFPSIFYSPPLLPHPPPPFPHFQLSHPYFLSFPSIFYSPPLLPSPPPPPTSNYPHRYFLSFPSIYSPPPLSLLVPPGHHKGKPVSRGQRGSAITWITSGLVMTYPTTPRGAGCNIPRDLRASEVNGLGGASVLVNEKGSGSYSIES
ncbi:hypothetical protein C7M84_019327 [Penaeus vannamei]|uniref:Uncharacterized protein n=1 Tax=Penaeus vannamei TaxID=6689 RepID=A0A423SF16_PENVA|nr:hypothetical protein C7M84_019327 [Penaeus vannamei]